MFRMQVNMRYRNADGTMVDNWQDVRPTKGKAYEYPTREEAERMLRSSYPNSIYGTEVRVVEMTPGPAL